MTYPTITFVDDQGELPRRDGAQFTVQYERADWWVRLSQPWPGEVAIQGSQPLKLMRRNGTLGTEWHVPPSPNVRVHLDAGQVRVMLTGDNGCWLQNAPTAVLNVVPTSLDDAAMSRMLERIALLAVSAASHTMAAMPLPHIEPLEEAMAGLGIGGAAHHLRLASLVLNLCDTLRSSWDVIRRRPLKSMAIGVGPIRSGGARTSARTMIAMVMHPSGRSILGMTRTDSLDCPENASIYYVLDHVRWLARAFAGLLTDSETTIQSRLDSEGADYAKHMSTLAPNYLGKSETLRHRLEECYRWAEHTCLDPLFSGTAIPPSIPMATRRLRGSPGYSAVHQAFMEFSAATGGSINKGLSIFQSVFSKCVKPTWEVYELWCFVQLYMMLVSSVGMRPPKGAMSILDAFHIVGDELQLRTGSDGLLLARKIEGGGELMINLSYNRPRFTSKGEERRPDIYAVVEYGGKELRLCFDAKYRDYHRQGLDTFERDVMRTAKSRYLEQLALDVSFIMHTDRTIDYWGEQPFADYLKSEFSFDHAETKFVGHKYGAIHFAPDDRLTVQCRKIIFLILRYHMAMTSVCFDCGKELAIGVEGENTTPHPGSYACPECERRWVVQHCRGSHHLILKTGPDCIHRPTRYADWGPRGGMYACPQCGSDFPKANLHLGLDSLYEPPYYDWWSQP